MDYERLFKYIGVASIVLLLFGLVGWYYFLRNEQSSIEDAANARGFSIGIPSFLGSRGSTAANTSRGGGAAQEFTDGSGSSAFARFLGFGQAGEGERLTAQTETQGGRTETKQTAPRFWHVTAAPIAGAAFMSGMSPRLRYVERASGHVFDVDPESGEVTRISNTLTPRVYEAMVGGGNSVMLRTLKDGQPITLGGVASTTAESDGLAALLLTDLGSAIQDVVAYPDTSQILMIARAGTQNHLIRSDANGGNPKQLFTIPGGDFRLKLAGDAIVLVERAASGIAGHAYHVTTNLAPVVRNVPGLTIALQPASQNVLYSSDDGEKLQLFAQRADASQAEIPLATTAEKCVWAPTGTVAYCAAPSARTPPQFLDQWYRGEVHTTDIWYTIDSAAGKANPLFTMGDSSAVDVENPVIDPGGKYLAFQNARDKSLWILRIAE